MKKPIWSATIIDVLLVFFPLIETASAIEYERYTTESVSEQEKIDFLEPKISEYLKQNLKIILSAALQSAKTA